MKITAPNPEFIGKVGGVGFVDGVANVDSLDPSVRAYMTRKGYVISDEGKQAKEPAAVVVPPATVAGAKPAAGTDNGQGADGEGQEAQGETGGTTSEADAATAPATEDKPKPVKKAAAKKAAAPKS